MKRAIGIKAISVWTVCILFFAFVISACGSNTATNSPSPSASAASGANSSAAPAANNDKKITLKLATWEQPTNLEAITKINEKFHAKYPNITVTLDTSKPDAVYQTLLQTRLNANDADIITDFSINPKREWQKGAAVPQLQQYIDAGLIEDLTGKSFLGNYFPDALKNAMTYKDKVWGITVGGVSFSGVFYNKDLFEKNGLKVPTTWNELMEVSKKLQDSGVAPFTLAGKDVWPIGMVSNGFLGAIVPDYEALDKKLWSGEVKFTDPVFTEILTKYQQMLNYTEKNFMGVDYASVVGRFASGQAAMMPDGMWNAGAIEKANPGLKFGYFPMPASDKAENNKNFYGKYDMSIMVAAKSQNKEAALKWLEFFSQPENYNEFINTVGFLPSQPNVKFKSAFMQELAPLASGMKPAVDQIWKSPQGAGDYTGGPAVVQFLKPAGPDAPADVQQKMQKEWEAEMKNVK